MKRFDGQPWATSQAVPPGAEIENATPARPANLTSDLVVPLGQAVVTGALLGGLFVLGLAELAPKFDGDLRKVWGMAALAISTVAWMILLGQTRRLLWAIERLTGLDLDGDRVTGNPQERVVIVNAAKGQQEAVQHENAKRASQFAQFVGQLPTRGTDARTWERQLGRDTYQEYRDALIRLGWARWNSSQKDGQPNKKKGWVLVLPAAEILRRVSG